MIYIKLLNKIYSFLTCVLTYKKIHVCESRIVFWVCANFKNWYYSSSCYGKK